MKKTFTLRVDLESDKGIKEGLPRILDLLKKHNLRASFYLVMGGESNIIEILRNRGKITSAGERRIKLWRLTDKIRMILFPRDFARGNVGILKRVLDEGHELGIHGWKHREWTRNLENINVEEVLKKSIKKYQKIFGKFPISFASPGFNTSEKVLMILEKNDIKYISDFEGNIPEKYGKLVNIPITIKGKNNTPFIEYWVGKGKNDKEIEKMFIEESKDKKIVSMYIHGMFEGRFKIELLDRIFSIIKMEKMKNKRVIDY